MRGRKRKFPVNYQVPSWSSSEEESVEDAQPSETREQHVGHKRRINDALEPQGGLRVNQHDVHENHGVGGVGQAPHEIVDRDDIVDQDDVVDQDDGANPIDDVAAADHRLNPLADENDESSEFDDQLMSSPNQGNFAEGNDHGRQVVLDTQQDQLLHHDPPPLENTGNAESDVDDPVMSPNQAQNDQGGQEEEIRLDQRRTK